MAKQETTTQTTANRPKGEHGTRDRVNDPRTKDGRFSRRHNDAANSVGDALKGLEAEGAKNAQQLPAEEEPTEQELLEAEES